MGDVEVGTVARWRLRVGGTVQGVGFRPFVYRTAVRLGLEGTVANDGTGVVIDARGPPDALADLCRAVGEGPPLARVDAVAVERDLDAAARCDGFRIVATRDGAAADTPVGVDTATCAACLAEVDDPANRRYRYPFTNCTDCGPRYTIVRSVPYDRAATTMAAFVMCGACRAEYDDPADRRFHAQPNACPACGPRLTFRWLAAGARDTDGRGAAGRGVDGPERRGDDALGRAVDALLAGAVVAVKGVGGFHLAVDATASGAVAELRRRKARDDKPFAVMVPDVAAARRLCRLDPAAEAALRSHRRPVVLAPRRDAGSPPAVAPGLGELGLMLPYTPLHHLLLAGVGRPLVMTSGNRSDEPIAHEDADARARLAPLADALVGHDRPIHVRCDDSVARARPAGVQLLRRSRGYAPEPLRLPVPAERPLVAVGAELKSTVTVARGRRAVTSHHLGDLEHPAAYAAFLDAVGHLCGLAGITPEVVAHDLHPEYLSTKLAVELDLVACPVQHHHAHVAACLVEHGLTGPVLGLAFDGLGYGTDGTLWGGEMLVADLVEARRAGHLRVVSQPGGTAAIREPWRMAVAWAHAAAGPEAAARIARRLAPDPHGPAGRPTGGGGAPADASAVRLPADTGGAAVADLVARDRGPRTSSAGRLLDAVAALLGVRRRVSYEGQAAIELEALARTVSRTAAPDYPVTVDRSGPAAVLDPAPLVAAVLAAVERGVAPAVVAAGVHDSLGRSAAGLAAELAAGAAVDTVVLCGGVFQNTRLAAVVEDELAGAGLRPLTCGLVPPNDGGISIGQAAVAAARTATGSRPGPRPGDAAPGSA